MVVSPRVTEALHRSRAYVYKNWTEKRSGALANVTLKISAYSSTLEGAENINKR